ncbi:PAS domain-containing sensor histidine kinase [Paeniglutamicibacter antarcticus]|uniref:Sensor-like histidine kinase SenX3 n=1 Tax=Arthrobacter terrae TaxID=2935737 RepID=A0A931CGW4_9MICC|nr:PAS domain-containing sensor histidine kinase [Arthrobacter terrae]MBG0738352.1 PAS domain-containing sensor histidine kinase [Arthrobacter terrae]
MSSMVRPSATEVPLATLLVGSGGRYSSLIRLLPLAITMFVTGAVFSAAYPQLLAEASFAAGYLVLLGSMVSSVLVPWHRLPRKAPLALPILGLLAIGLARVGSQSVLDVLGLMTVFPAIWLATSDKYRGVAVSTAGTAAIVVVPLLLAGTPFTSQQWARLALLPLVVAAVGLTVSVITGRLEAQTRGLRAATFRLKAALARAGEQKQLLQSILDAVEVGVVAVDADGNTLLTNNPGLAEEHMAAKRAQLRGAPRIEWEAMGEGTKIMYESDRRTPIPPERRPVARANRGEIYSNYLFWTEEHGRRLAYYATSRPVLDAEGRTTGFVIAFANISALMEATAAQNGFVASVSHELRTPLTSILGYTDLLRERLEDSAVNPGPELDIIERNAERLRTRVQDLMSAAESTLSMTPVQMDLTAVVHSAVESIAPAANTRSISIINEVSGPLVALADPDRIGQVLDNLFSNAVKYSEPETTVTVRCHKDAVAGQAVVEIQDQGVGIAEEDQDHVFTQFFRSETARNSNTKGFGLGLNVVKSIVERHGGSIRLLSSPGHGTTAVLRLPLGTSS